LKICHRADGKEKSLISFGILFFFLPFSSPHLVHEDSDEYFLEVLGLADLLIAILK
jgi:hypothetical protein